MQLNSYWTSYVSIEGYGTFVTWKFLIEIFRFRKMAFCEQFVFTHCQYDSYDKTWFLFNRWFCFKFHEKNCDLLLTCVPDFGCRQIAEFHFSLAQLFITASFHINPKYNQSKLKWSESQMMSISQMFAIYFSYRLFGFIHSFVIYFGFLFISFCLCISTQFCHHRCMHLQRRVKYIQRQHLNPIS